MRLRRLGRLSWLPPAGSIILVVRAVGGHERRANEYPAHTILAACLVELGDLQHARELVSMVWQQRRAYMLSRLEGKNFFSVASLGERYTSALRQAANFDFRLSAA